MIKVVLFDIFGTVVDWRSSINREATALAASHRINNFDGDKFARTWRAGYHPGMAKVTSGERRWISIDAIHREILDNILPDFGLNGLSESEKKHLNEAWHRLTPWPDSVLGLIRIKSKYLISPLSNGSLILLSEMAKKAGLPWDFILSSEMHRAYKPDPKVFENTIKVLGLKPEKILMVAAHNRDLEAARKVGMGTAYVNRPSEYGVDQKIDLEASEIWDFIDDSLEGLAEKLGCPNFNDLKYDSF